MSETLTVGQEVAVASGFGGFHGLRYNFGYTVSKVGKYRIEITRNEDGHTRTFNKNWCEVYETDDRKTTYYRRSQIRTDVEALRAITSHAARIKAANDSLEEVSITRLRNIYGTGSKEGLQDIINHLREKLEAAQRLVNEI